MVYTPAFAALLEERRSTLKAQLDAYLPKGAPFVWEIGSGHGHFLVAYATAHPSQVCMGIDIASDRVERAQRKRDRAKLANLHFLQAEARLFLDTLDENARFSRVFVLFPDPWPKARHNKHRIIQPSVLAAIAAHAAPDCRIYFRTDHAEYFAAAREVFASDPHWEIEDTPWPFEYATVFQQRASSYHSLVARPRTAAGPAKPAPSLSNAP